MFISSVQAVFALVVCSGRADKTWDVEQGWVSGGAQLGQGWGSGGAQLGQSPDLQCWAGGRGVKQGSTCV